MNNPGKPHWDAVKQIIRYLKGTSNYGINLGGESKPLRGYSDADYASNDIDSRRSYLGYLFYLNDGLISWNSKLQSKPPAQSSTESEYIALANAANESTWLRSLLSTISPTDGPTVIFCDNQSSITLAHNPHHHARTKHIDVRHHVIRDQVASMVLQLEHVPSSDNLADVLTKPLSASVFSKFQPHLISAYGGV
jgi:hypothetical protein